MEVATRLATGSQLAIRWTKRALNNWLRQAGPIFDHSLALEMLGFFTDDVTEGLQALKDKRPVYGYRFEGKRHDAGNKLGFLKATVEFALKREDLGGPFRAYLKSLQL